jgi:AcrR family transcriptional regulator
MKHDLRTTRLPRKEREKLARKMEILKAARELFILKGYHQTTLEEIAHHAEFGKGTIYIYFSSKEELFYGIIYQLMDEIVQLASSAISDSPGTAREKLTAYAKKMISHARMNSDLFHLIMREIQNLKSQQKEAQLNQMRKRASQIYEILARPIEAEIQAKKIKSFDPLKMAALFDNMVRFCCINQFGKLKLFKNEVTDDAVSFIVTIFFDGITERKFKG